MKNAGWGTGANGWGHAVCLRRGRQFFLSAFLPVLVLISLVFVLTIKTVHGQNAASPSVQTLTVASIDWCPQLCPDNKDKGYIWDIVHKVFEDEKFALDILTVPWTRAIDMTRHGQAVALLSPAKGEAPDLVYPDYPVGHQQMCFFTRAHSNWRYAGPQSLFTLKTGVVMDATLEELDEVTRDNPDLFLFMPYDEKFILRGARMLDSGRLDTFLFTRNTTLFEFKRHGILDRYRIAGCVVPSPIYMAFSPVDTMKLQVDRLKTFFDQRMGEMESNGDAARIRAAYGIEFDG